MRVLFFVVSIFLTKASRDNIVTPHLPRVKIDKNGELLNKGNISGHIVGGSAASLGQFPWQAGLALWNNDGYIYGCGGVLIHLQWIATAAHCTRSSYKATVRLGGLNRTTGGILTTVNNASSIITHPNFSFSNLNNDIGLIKMPNAVTPSSSIKVIEFYKTATVTGSLIVSGWGMTCGNCPVSNYLQYATVSAITNARCMETWGSNINEKKICTIGATNQSPCMGDSGGPLMQYNTAPNTVTYLVGLVSFGSSQCGTFPAAYTRASSFCPWIKTNYIPSLICA